MHNSNFLVQVTTPWPSVYYKFGRVQMTSDPLGSSADALLCVWRPMHKLREFEGPKCLYNCEPVTNGRMGARDFPEWRGLLDELGVDGWLYHAHPDANCRVPHVTHRKVLQVVQSSARLRRVVAVISNAGGNPSHRWDSIVERNAFGTASDVDLYGKPNAWRRYKTTRWAFARQPKNYCGPIQGGWGEDNKVQLMGKYHAALCFENTQEPLYFTEKFLDAVAAGCVPIYRAHSTVRETFLQGAAWIDPADYGDSVKITIEAALAADRQAIAEQNSRWLKSPAVVATRENVIYMRIASILCARVIQSRL